jgi:hypothetical protein
MELLFASLIILILIIIVLGSVAWCYRAARDARHARHNSDVAFDALSRLERDIEELRGMVMRAEMEAAQNAPQSARDERTARIERQYAKMQEYQLHDYGMTFDGKEEGLTDEA